MKCVVIENCSGVFDWKLNREEKRLVNRKVYYINYPKLKQKGIIKYKSSINETRTNSTAIYAYNLSPKSMRKKVTENNFQEVMTGIFFYFMEIMKL